MSARLYIEGGGDSKEGHVRCREGFCKLLMQLGLSGKMPRLIACGGRGAVFDAFKTAHKKAGRQAFVAMLLDSENTLDDLEKTWEHLQGCDQWERPKGADDEQVLFMTTSMETWIVADRQTLGKHYGHCLQESALPALENLEQQDRRQVVGKLERASRPCSNAYSKGVRSFTLLGKLDAVVLCKALPSFARMCRILKKKV